MLSLWDAQTKLLCLDTKTPEKSAALAAEGLLAVVAAVAPQVISKTSVQSHILYRILMFPDFCFRTEGSKGQGHIAVEEAEAAEVVEGTEDAEALQVAIEHLTTSPPNN